MLTRQELYQSYKKNISNAPDEFINDAYQAISWPNNLKVSEEAQPELIRARKDLLATIVFKSPSDEARLKLENYYNNQVFGIRDIVSELVRNDVEAAQALKEHLNIFQAPYIPNAFTEISGNNISGNSLSTHSRIY